MGRIGRNVGVHDFVGDNGMATRESDLSATLIELADTLVSDYELFEFLDVLLARSTRWLGSQAGGVMLRDVDGQLQLLAWVGDRMDVVELFQLQRRQGPCHDSVVERRQVIEPDLAQTSRWPQFTEVAVREGYRSVAAFPLRLREQHIGAMNVFWREPRRAATDDISAVQAFADMATIGILHERAVQRAEELSEQLQSALRSRVLLEQAKGVLAERSGLDVDAAFRVLRGYSRNSNRRLRDVAAEVIAGEVTIATLASRAGPAGAGLRRSPASQDGIQRE